MSTVKITELPLINQTNANTANTLFMGVDVPTNVTGKMTLHTLAQGLYSNEILNVGNNIVNLPNTIAQFSLSGNSYIQTNLVNLNDGGTADIVVTGSANSSGTDSTYFTDLGFANINVQPGLEFNNLGTALYPRDGYLYVQGAAVGGAAAAGGNLLIGTTSTNTSIKFIGGGYNSENVVAKISHQGFTLLNGHPITFTDGSTQNTAAASNAYSISAYTQANTANTSAQTAYTLANTTNTVTQSAFSKANTANVIAQAAYDKANTGIANTSGVITAGDFNVGGNLTVLGVGTSGLFTINAVSYVANTPAFRISGSANNVSQAPLNQGYMMQITGFANTASRIVVDSFGTNAYSAFIGRSARGTANTPLATANGDILLRISGNGYANAFSQFGQARIDLVAAENFTDTARGTQIQFWNTKIGSNSLVQIATFNGEKITFTGDVTPAKGFVYTPTVYPGAQTAITIDFANNAVIRAQTAAGLVVSFTNYTVGKVIEAWITNTSGSNQTFTHGVSALNSTTNSTTYNIPATSTILAKYICIDGTLANTLVSVIHA